MVNKSGKKKSHAKKSATYSKGDLNKMVDTLIHPLSKTDKRFILVDGFLHGLIERDPPTTIKKFLKYNLPEILKQLEKETSEH